MDVPFVAMVLAKQYSNSSFTTGDVNKQQRGSSVPEKHGKVGARKLYTSEMKNECHLRADETPKTDTSDHKDGQYRAKKLRRRCGRKLRENSKRHEHYHKYHGNMGKETPPEFGPCLQLTVK